MIHNYFLEDGDLLEQIEFVKEFLNDDFVYINEGLLNKLPQDIHKLKSSIKETIKEIENDSSKTKHHKSIITDICNKNNIKITNIQNERSHKKDSKAFTVYGIYKDYIIDILFIISLDNETSSVKVQIPMINVDYDKDKCDIPKNVAFEVLSYFNSSKIWRFKCGEKNIEIAAHSKSVIDSLFNKLENKYSKEYDIIKNSDGLSIKIYIKKDKE